MSLTEEQLRANRENAQKSTGPQTPEGKQRSSINGLRHGLCSRVVVLPHEDMQAYNAFRQEWLDEYKPHGITERQLVERLCDCQWRLNRAASYEDGIYAIGHFRNMTVLDTGHPETDNTLAGAMTVVESANALNNLSRHEMRIQKQFDGALKQLRELQAERKQKEQADRESSVAVYKLHIMLDEEFLPQDFGFALSAAEIAGELRIADRIQQAQIAKTVGYNKQKFLQATAGASSIM